MISDGVVLISDFNKGCAENHVSEIQPGMPAHMHTVISVISRYDFAH